MSLLILFLNPAIQWPGLVGLGVDSTAVAAVGMTTTANIAMGTAVIAYLSPTIAGDT